MRSVAHRPEVFHVKHRGRLAEILAAHSLPAAAAEPLLTLLTLVAEDVAPTSVHDPAQAVDVHIADSLAGLVVADVREARVVADLGAGAGFPGLVLAVALPDARITLVESIGRKCAFLRDAVAAMELANVDVVQARAEEWRDGLGSCDVVCARALAALPVLCEYAAPLLRDHGVLVAWKGAVDDAEAADGDAAARELGLEPERIVPVRPYSGSANRTLHVIRKIAPTPPGFPRRAGMASKRPLSARKLR